MSTQTQTQIKAPSRPKPTFTAVPTGLLQRKCACGGSPGVDGECEECREQHLSLQRRATNQAEPATVPPTVHDVLRAPGQPLDAATRAFMEPRFGHDFSQVRVHTDARAAESARAVNAQAYTVGRDVVFGTGQYGPGTLEGKRLLAHELTHVLQQGWGNALLQRAGTKANGESKLNDGIIQVTPMEGPTLSRQPFPGVIGRCKAMGVPCPAPQAFHGQICRLRDCYRAATAGLPFAISPGVCIYQCENGTTCACVLLGTSTSAVCTFTFCSDTPGIANTQSDLDNFVVAAVDAFQQQYTSQSSDQGQNPPALQAKLEIGQRGDLYEQEADHIAEKVVRPLQSELKPGSVDDVFEQQAKIVSGTGMAIMDLPNLSQVGRPFVQRAPRGDEELLSRGSTLPYREATELLECIRIMGEDNAAYCRQEVLGEKPIRPLPPMPPVCNPNRSLTWADYAGTPGSGPAFTGFHHGIETVQGEQIIRAFFDPSRSWVQPQFSNPTNQALSGCARNISVCERFFDAEAAAGRTGGTQRLGPLRPGCPASVTANPSVTATSRAECSSVLGPECDRVAQLESGRLLRHEQLHFDIACVLARKGNGALAAGSSQAQVILASVRAKANQQTALYDRQTQKGCIAAAQSQWDTDVNNDLPGVSVP